MKHTLSIVLPLMLLLSVSAKCQTKVYGNEKDAELLLRQTVATLKKNAFQAKFTLDYYIANEERTDSKIGSIDIKGRFFRVELLDTEIKFNGKTQWTYVAADNEVTITEPSQSDLNETNPMAMIESMMDNNRIVNAEQKQVKKFRVINLYPNNPKKVEYFKIVLYINPETKLPKKIVINQRNGDKISMSFLDLHKVAYNPSRFVFKISEYPNVTVNDLR
ncbi:MAG: outer membrane lipoprotein carrier protein LolA [Paludibacteraceae bacterium]|nr:outer membrane lipoprotein carrier protein LolA [Paludibacteraceae bacterium]